MAKEERGKNSAKKEIPILNWATRSLMVLANLTSVACIVLFIKNINPYLAVRLGIIAIVLAVICGLFTIGRAIGWDEDDYEYVGTRTGSHYETTIDLSTNTATTREVGEYPVGKSRIITFLISVVGSSVFLPFGIIIAFFYKWIALVFVFLFNLDPVKNEKKKRFWHTIFGKTIAVLLKLIAIWLVLMAIAVIFWFFFSAACGTMMYDN